MALSVGSEPALAIKCAGRLSARIPLLGLCGGRKHEKLHYRLNLWGSVSLKYLPSACIHSLRCEIL